VTVPTTSGQAFAAASAAMVRGVDGASTVHVLLNDCVALLGADTAGVLVRVGEHGLDMLAATSHRAVELELYQSQLHSGPCVATIETGASVSASGAAELHSRWPKFAQAMEAAGVHTVHAEPMKWHDRVLGGMNLFWRGERVLSAEEQELARSFADICTVALMQARVENEPMVIAERVRAALEARVVIERAKGVLAQTEDVAVDEAFALLVERSREQSLPLSVVADGVLRDIVG
jgi:GAF domain-containing protein